MKRSAFSVETAVGLFLLLSLIALLALAFASTNGRIGFGASRYEITARFSNTGELRPRAPVKIGGVTVGEVSRVELDPKTFEAVATLSIDGDLRDIPADSSAAVYTSGLLGERYVAISPGGDPEPLAPGDEVLMTQSAVVLEQLIGKYIFGGTESGKGDKDDSESNSGTN